MRFKRCLSIAVLSILLIGALVLATGCGLLPSMRELFGMASDMVEEELAPEGEERSTEADDTDDPAPEPAESEPADEPDDEDPAGEPELSVDGWYNPNSISDLVDTFERFDWVWANISEGEEGESNRVSYRFEGTETVDGVDAEKVALSFKDDEIVLWLDGDRSVVRAQVNDDPVPSMALDSILEPVLDAAFAPFAAVEDINIQGLITGTQDYGWNWQVVDKSPESIGEMRAEVTTLEVEIGPPYADEGKEVRARWAIADFGDLQMLVEWESEEGGAGSGYGITLEVEALALR